MDFYYQAYQGKRKHCLQRDFVYADAVVAKVVETYGWLDRALNNTGIGERGALTHEYDEEGRNQILAVNLTRAAHSAAPGLCERDRRAKTGSRRACDCWTALFDPRQSACAKLATAGVSTLTAAMLAAIPSCHSLIRSSAVGRHNGYT